MRSILTSALLSLSFMAPGVGVTALAAGDDMTPPAALSSPGGMVYATVGEPVEFTVCGESFVGGEIEIDPIGAPDWCDRASSDGDCETYTATPDTAGVHTLWFRIVDDENDMETAYAVTIEARGSECQDFPTCSFDLPGPIMIVAGETRMIDFCFDTVCTVDELRFIEVSFPQIGFCTPGLPMPNPNGSGYCATITCSPTLTDVGTHFLAYQVLDDDNGFATRCSIFIEVSAPEVCMEPPSCIFDPPGPIKLTVGQTGTVHFDIFTSCVDHDVDLGMITGDADFCQFVELQPLGAGAMRATFSCAPTASDVGMRTLTVSGRDTTNNLTTQCSLMIEVNQPDTCMEPPTCGFEPAGPVKIVAGQAQEIKFSWRSYCPDSTANILNPSFPSFCQMSPITTLPDGTNCFTLTCAPGLNDVGLHTINQVVQDNSSQMETTCSIEIEVNAPEGCFDPPTCGITPAGPITIRAGQTEVIEFCASPGCDVSTVAFVNPSFPAFCDMSMVTVMPDGSACFSLTCSPGVGDIGMYTLGQIVEDQTTFEQNTCSIMIEVIPCEDPPTCTITPEGPITVLVGEEVSFEVCGESFCDGVVTIDSSPLPGWLMSSPVGQTGSELCIPFSGTPPPGAVGTHTIDFEIKDSINGIVTPCSVEIIVLCSDPPICTFTEQGPIKVAVGEEIDFEFCGVAVCDGHKARIEMTSRPPFIDPAGHQKGGPDELLCLPIQGTPGPEDVGYWNVRITTEDLDTGIESECSIQIIVTGPDLCEAAPICEIEQGDEINTTPGDSVGIDFCALSMCEGGSVLVELAEAPEFCGPFEPVLGATGEEVCVTLDCAIPADAEFGEYTVRFRVTDQDNGTTSDCELTLNVGGPSGLACLEEEPNDDFSTCTFLDINDCANLGCGSSVIGVLGTSGDDVDYYCFSGLAPLTDYQITIISGVDCDGAPTCASIGCLDANGEVISASSSGGPVQGYPAISCASDANGFIQIVVSGCNDLDFDGMTDDIERGGIGHGSRGSYQMAISPLTPTAINMACHADMNGDGIVDSSDLGMMIGVFGETCAP